MDIQYYKNLARILISRIGERHYFNGTAEAEGDGFCGLLRITAIIYREQLHDPADRTGSMTRITNIVPVWWEFSSYGPEGVIPNDFSWSEFLPYLSAAC